MAISNYTPSADRIVHSTAVDFKERMSFGQPVHLMQYDKSLPVVAVSLYSGGKLYSIPSNADVCVRVGKPDGTKVYNPVLGCNTDRTICYFEVTQQMTSAYGTALAILEITVGGDIAGSSYVPLDIAKNPAQDDAIESSDEYQIMTEVIADAQAVLSNPPKIQNGTWWIWDSSTKAYVDSGYSAGGGGDSSFYICTVTSNICDHTPLEILTAKSNGLIPILVADGITCFYYGGSNTTAYFIGNSGNGKFVNCTVNQNKNVTSTASTMQDASKRVTSLSSTQTDVQYPSAKAVWNAIPHPVAKTAAMTQEVGADESGKLYTVPGNGSGTQKLVVSITVSALNKYDESPVVDKTYAEIKVAYDAGKDVYAMVKAPSEPALLARCLDVNTGFAMFSAVYMDSADTPNDAVSLCAYVNADGSNEAYVGINHFLPDATEADNDKVPVVKNGSWKLDNVSGGGAVSSVNGQTGDVKTSWYFNVTGSVTSPTTTQTIAQIVAAQDAGFAPICSATFSDFQGLPATLPALLISSQVCVFGGIGSTGGDAFYVTVMIDGTGNLTAKTHDVAIKEDIPTAMKNPYALNIKIGNATTVYDGSSGKTVEIPANSYTLPVASATTLGGVKPTAKTSAMSQPVGVDADGALYTEPGDYTLTDADKTEIAADVIAGGIEAQLGDSLPTPTDAQVNTAVSSWLTAHPEATTTVQDGAVTVEKLGYGKHFYGSKPYFCNTVGSGAKVYGAIGVVVPCKAGDTIYTNFNAATNSSAKLPTILTAFPETQYGDITSITLATLPVDNDTKQYTIPADKTTAKAFYVPVNFLSIPAEDNASVESAVAWINNKIGLDGRTCAQTVPFDKLDSWYQAAQTNMFSVDESCNKLMYASLFQAVSRLVGAKVAVLGDSLTEQSACSFINSANNERWMENVLRDNTQTGDDGKTYSGSGWFALIARKYRLKWWCAGHGLQWWYSTTARPNGATAMVRKLIDGTDEFDYIVLEYGTNDILSGSIGTASDAASETAATSCGAIKWCIEQLQARFPEASIVVILPNIRNGANGEPPAKQQTYLDTVVPLLKKYGVRYVNMAEDSGIAKSMMYTDGIHLHWPVVANNVTYYTNDTPAVRKYSKCLESVLLQA